MSKAKNEKWGFVFEALADEVPAVNRVRRFLKMALRSYGLKNVKVLSPEECETLGKPIPPVEDADASKDEPPF